MAVNRLSPAEEAAAVAAIKDGTPAKAVARQFGIPYRTMMDIACRHGHSPKFTDDPARLRLRERWRRNTAAMRARNLPTWPDRAG